MNDIDAALAHIDRMRKKLRGDFGRDMAKLDDDERDLLGLRKLLRDGDGNILGFDDAQEG